MRFYDKKLPNKESCLLASHSRLKKNLSPKNCASQTFHGLNTPEIVAVSSLDVKGQIRIREGQTHNLIAATKYSCSMLPTVKLFRSKDVRNSSKLNRNTEEQTHVAISLACVASVSVGLSADLKHISLFERAKILVGPKKYCIVDLGQASRRILNEYLLSWNKNSLTSVASSGFGLFLFLSQAFRLAVTSISFKIFNWPIVL